MNPARRDESCTSKERVTHLNSLRAFLIKGVEVGQGKAAHNEDDNHDGELEEGIQSRGKNLCCCQA